MPSRNAIKSDVEDSYYHIYARGSNKQVIFPEPQDYFYFLKLFERYLSSKPSENKSGRSYPKYTNQIELLCYCLMTNHFHIMIYQINKGSMTALMRSIMTSYSKYFNLKYKQTGPVFESRYKAARIDSQTYLEHISRYIHLNPRYWKRYQYSSLRYYQGDEVDWVKTKKVLDLFKNKAEHMRFLENYEDHKQMLHEIKHELADN